ncbi:MAG: CMP-NeuNAc synthetase, partial [Parcubacteria group bacterium GW2011_GWA2_47_8b]
KERAVFDQEKPVWVWAKRSVVAVRDIAAGEMLNRSMITSKRPGTGIRSKEYHKIIGKKTKRSIPAGSIIQWEDIEI